MKLNSRFLLLLACLFIAGRVAAETEVAKVIAVLDGDTVLLMATEVGSAPQLFYKFRLADIDAPEKGQPDGARAAQALSEQVLKQQVYVTTVATDAYGRAIGWLALTRDAGIEETVNSKMVRRGWAWALSRSRSQMLREAQQEAQRARRGLWASGSAIPPWVWRKQHAPVQATP